MVMTTLSPKQPGASAAGKRSDRALPKDIWTLALVSLLMDSSSELIHSLPSIFMATTLGASMITIGMVEGVAEATAAMPLSLGPGLRPSPPWACCSTDPMQRRQRIRAKGRPDTTASGPAPYWSFRQIQRGEWA